jgi:hypothetical protein
LENSYFYNQTIYKKSLEMARKYDFESLSRATEDDPFACDYVSLETERSPKLSELFNYFVAVEQKSFTPQELISFGVDAIALPDLSSVLSKGRHFRPLDSLGFATAAHQQIDITYKGIKPPVERTIQPGPITHILQARQKKIYTEPPLLLPEGEKGYWSQIEYRP